MHEPISIDDSLAAVVRRGVVDDDDGAVADEPQHRADLRVALARRRGVADAVPRTQARYRDMLAGLSRSHCRVVAGQNSPGKTISTSTPRAVSASEPWRCSTKRRRLPSLIYHPPPSPPRSRWTASSNSRARSSGSKRAPRASPTTLVGAAPVSG